MSKSITLVPVELAGRGGRIGEAPYSSVEEAVEDLYRYITGKLQGPFAFFGHSMGSLLAYELICQIYERCGLQPAHAFFSGGKAPHYAHNRKIKHLLPEDEFKQELQSLGGTPPEFFENKELSDLFLPIIRSDYKLVETYAYKERGFKMDCDITVFNGKQEEIPPAELSEWSKHTKGSCKVIHYDGGHFFINDHAAGITRLINETLIPGQQQSLFHEGSFVVNPKA